MRVPGIAFQSKNPPEVFGSKTMFKHCMYIVNSCGCTFYTRLAYSISSVCQSRSTVIFVRVREPGAEGNGKRDSEAKQGRKHRSGERVGISSSLPSESQEVGGQWTNVWPPAPQQKVRLVSSSRWLLSSMYLWTHPFFVAVSSCQHLPSSAENSFIFVADLQIVWLAGWNVVNTVLVIFLSLRRWREYPPGRTLPELYSREDSRYCLLIWEPRTQERWNVTLLKEEVLQGIDVLSRIPRGRVRIVGRYRSWPMSSLDHQKKSDVFFWIWLSFCQQRGESRSKSHKRTLQPNKHGSWAMNGFENKLYAVIALT